MLVQNIIDLDSFLEKITENSPDKYYNLLYCLLDSPSTHNMATILSFYPISDLVNSIKHLIKFKYNSLTDKIRASLVECVEMLMQYNENVDTLVINCLRIGLISELNEIFRRQPKYFETHRMGVAFLAFHTQDPKLLQRLGPVSRDFYFKKVLKHLSAPEAFTSIETESLNTPTPISYITSAIFVELELDIIFISNVKNNFSFYKKLVVGDFIKSEEVTFRVLRFCVYIPFTNNVYLLSKAIVDKYPLGIIALIYDLLFYNGKENIPTLAIKWINIMKNKINKQFPSLNDLRKLFINFEGALSTIYNNKNVEETTKLIYNFNFPRYYEAIQEMKDKKIPLVGHELYEEIITTSQEWDNYMQVYLWKVLAFQKLMFNFDIPEVELSSFEAKEGAELLKSIKRK